MCQARFEVRTCSHFTVFNTNIVNHMTVNQMTVYSHSQVSEINQRPGWSVSLGRLEWRVELIASGCTTNRLQVKRHTLEEICNRLGINSSFMEAVSVPSIWSKQSCGSFHRLEPDDNRRALGIFWSACCGSELIFIDGFYHYFENWELGPLHLWVVAGYLTWELTPKISRWFSYDPFSRSTTYLLIDCPERSKEIIERKAQTKERDFLLQPLAIDYLIAEECASWREVYINTRWKKVFDWVSSSGNEDEYECS